MKHADIVPAHLRALVEQNYEICCFRDLSLPFQLAIAHYMAIDGEAWEAKVEARGIGSPSKLVAALKQAMPGLTRRYAGVRFGRSMLKASALKRALLASESCLADGIRTWPDYLARLSHAGVEHPRTNRWPVILSGFEDEVLQDGWHRMGCYLQRGDRLIPAVFYPRT
jgi:hypothetical protein